MNSKPKSPADWPRISAVIPTFNRRNHVGRAIRSILSQSASIYEVLVVDDGSTDGTAEAIRAEFGETVRVVSQPNGGVSSARRRGIELARGDWVAFLDSDDEWTPGRLALLGGVVCQEMPDVDWVFGDTEMLAENSSTTIFREFGLHLNQPVTRFDDALATQFPFQFSILESSLIRRARLLETGAFLEGLRSSEDFLVSFRAALSCSFAAVPQLVTRAYRTPDLQGSQLSAGWRADPDYFRARAIAFGEAATRDPSGPWPQLHAQAVRGWCRALAARGVPCRRLSLSQFRYDRSPKAFAFLAAALMGVAGVRAWIRLSALRA